MSIVDFVRNSIVPAATGGVVVGPTMPALGGAMSPQYLKGLAPNQTDTPEMRAIKTKRLQDLLKMKLQRKPTPMTPEMMTPPDIMERRPPTNILPEGPVGPQRLAPTYTPRGEAMDQSREYERLIRELQDRIAALEARQPQQMPYQGRPGAYDALDRRVYRRTLERRPAFEAEPITDGSFSNY